MVCCRAFVADLNPPRLTIFLHIRYGYVALLLCDRGRNRWNRFLPRARVPSTGEIIGSRETNGIIADFLLRADIS